MSALLIECTLKRQGGTRVELNGKNYHFAPDDLGRHVCEVEDPDDVAAFLGVKEAYRLIRPTAPVVPVPPAPPIPAPAPAKVGADMPVVQPGPPKSPAPMGLSAEPQSLEDLAKAGRDAIVAAFIAEVGRKPSGKADEETMLAQIKAKRAAAA